MNEVPPSKEEILAQCDLCNRLEGLFADEVFRLIEMVSLSFTDRVAVSRLKYELERVLQYDIFSLTQEIKGLADTK